MQQVFHLILIKPTHYDDDGYPLQWRTFTLPSNSLACLYGLARDCRERQVLGEQVDIRIHAIDESSRRVDPQALLKMIAGQPAFVGLVGVQSNQFPRAVDIARPFVEQGVPACIGGFHVSGCVAMLDELPPEMQQAQQLGISFFLGEAEEGRLDELLIDAFNGRLKPVYDHLEELPGLPDAPVPFLPREQLGRTYGNYGSFDLGRGCPFKCSFCTIINVQGRKSRFRSADDLERIVRMNHEIGVHDYFLTDDNFARNRNWEACLDRLIELREREGIRIRMVIQVDTMSHKIRGFIDKCCRAGVDQVFIGMENINAENLLAAKKRQNKISEYKELLLAWKRYPVVVCAGYIIGFPADSKASLLRDVEIIKRELAIDHIFFTLLTPLPGSEDHRKLQQAGVWMDPDMNKYDLNHVVTEHPSMSRAELEEAYEAMWEHFYTYEHMRTVFRRMLALGSNKKRATLHRLLFYREFKRIYRVHPLEGGFLRMKHRADRRPGLPREPAWRFYPRYWLGSVLSVGRFLSTYFRLRLILRQVLRDPHRHEYRDEAITPPEEVRLPPVEVVKQAG